MYAWLREYSTPVCLLISSRNSLADSLMGGLSGRGATPGGRGGLPLQHAHAHGLPGLHLQFVLHLFPSSVLQSPSHRHKCGRPAPEAFLALPPAPALFGARAAACDANAPAARAAHKAGAVDQS